MAPTLPSGPVMRSGARRASFVILISALVAGAVTLTMGPSLATHPAAGQTRAAPVPHGPDQRQWHHPASISLAVAHRDELARLAAIGQPIYCGAGTKPLIALTFDDGPGLLTPRALRVLRRHGAEATFFLVGRLLDQPSYAALAALEASKGMALGNHTWDHVSMLGSTPGRLAQQITATSTAVRSATGQRPRLFRPPFGFHDRGLDRWLKSRGLLEVLWSTDSLDSQGANTRKVLKMVIRGIRPGAIILLHENRGTAETALPRILHVIAERGLTPVTVPDLLAEDPPTLEQLRQHTCN